MDNNDKNNSTILLKNKRIKYDESPNLSDSHYYKYCCSIKSSPKEKNIGYKLRNSIVKLKSISKKFNTNYNKNININKTNKKISEHKIKLNKCKILSKKNNSLKKISINNMLYNDNKVDACLKKNICEDPINYFNLNITDTKKVKHNFFDIKNSENNNSYILNSNYKFDTNIGLKRNSYIVKKQIQQKNVILRKLFYQMTQTKDCNIYANSQINYPFNKRFISHNNYKFEDVAYGILYSNTIEEYFQTDAMILTLMKILVNSNQNENINDMEDIETINSIIYINSCNNTRSTGCHSTMERSNMLYLNLTSEENDPNQTYIKNINAKKLYNDQTDNNSESESSFDDNSKNPSKIIISLLSIEQKNKLFLQSCMLLKELNLEGKILGLNMIKLLMNYIPEEKYLNSFSFEKNLMLNSVGSNNNTNTKNISTILKPQLKNIKEKNKKTIDMPLTNNEKNISYCKIISSNQNNTKQSKHFKPKSTIKLKSTGDYKIKFENDLGSHYGFFASTLDDERKTVKKMSLKLISQIITERKFFLFAKKSFAYIIEIIHDEEEDVRISALKCLDSITKLIRVIPSEKLDILYSVLGDKNKQIRLLVLEILKKVYFPNRYDYERFIGVMIDLRNLICGAYNNLNSNFLMLNNKYKDDEGIILGTICSTVCSSYLNTTIHYSDNKQYNNNSIINNGICNSNSNNNGICNNNSNSSNHNNHPTNQSIINQNRYKLQNFKNDEYINSNEFWNINLLSLNWVKNNLGISKLFLLPEADIYNFQYRLFMLILLKLIIFYSKTFSKKQNYIFRELFCDNENYGKLLYNSDLNDQRIQDLGVNNFISSIMSNKDKNISLDILKLKDIYFPKFFIRHWNFLSEEYPFYFLKDEVSLVETLLINEYNNISNVVFTENNMLNYNIINSNNQYKLYNDLVNYIKQLKEYSMNINSNNNIPIDNLLINSVNMNINNIKEVYSGLVYSYTFSSLLKKFVKNYITSTDKIISLSKDQTSISLSFKREGFWILSNLFSSVYYMIKYLEILLLSYDIFTINDQSSIDNSNITKNVKKQPICRSRQSEKNFNNNNQLYNNFNENNNTDLNCNVSQNSDSETKSNSNNILNDGNVLNTNINENNIESDKEDFISNNSYIDFNGKSSKDNNDNAKSNEINTNQNEKYQSEKKRKEYKENNIELNNMYCYLLNSLLSSYFSLLSKVIEINNVTNLKMSDKFSENNYDYLNNINNNDFDKATNIYSSELNNKTSTNSIVNILNKHIKKLKINYRQYKNSNLNIMIKKNLYNQLYNKDPESIVVNESLIKTLGNYSYFHNHNNNINICNFNKEYEPSQNYRNRIDTENIYKENYKNQIDKYINNRKIRLNEFYQRLTTIDICNIDLRKPDKTHYIHDVDHFSFPFDLKTSMVVTIPKRDDACIKEKSLLSKKLGIFFMFNTMKENKDKELTSNSSCFKSLDYKNNLIKNDSNYMLSINYKKMSLLTFKFSHIKQMAHISLLPSTLTKLRMYRSAQFNFNNEYAGLKQKIEYDYYIISKNEELCYLLDDIYTELSGFNNNYNKEFLGLHIINLSFWNIINILLSNTNRSYNYFDNKSNKEKYKHNLSKDNEYNVVKNKLKTFYIES